MLVMMLTTATTRLPLMRMRLLLRMRMRMMRSIQDVRIRHHAMVAVRLIQTDEGDADGDAPEFSQAL